MSESQVLAPVPLAGYPPEVGLALWSLEDARARTLGYLNGTGDAVVNWTPTSQRYGIGTLLYHIVVFEMDWLFADLLGEPLPPEVEAVLPYNLLAADGSYTMVVGESLAVHVARMERTGSILLGALRTMSEEDFQRLREFDTPASPRWIVHHLAQHEAEHRGPDLGSPGRCRKAPGNWLNGSGLPGLVLCLGNSVRVSARPRRSWPGRTTKAQPMRCVEEEDAARGVVGRRDPKTISQTVHQGEPQRVTPSPP
jgi:hypothetical protein